MHKFILINIVLFYSLLSLAQGIPADAQKLFDAKKFNESIVILDEIIKTNSSDLGSIEMRAMAWDSLKDYSKVAENYSLLINLDAQNPNFFYQRGRAYYKKALYEEALSDLNKSISLKMDLWDAYFIRGDIYFNVKKDPKNAKSDFSKYIDAEIFTRKSDAYLNRGKIFEQEGSVDKALADYNSAIQHNQFNKEAYLVRGILKLNNSDDGCPDLQKYFKLKGKDAQMYLEKYCM